MSRSILYYFSKKQSEAHLPDPRGLLSSKMLPSTITAANTEVMHVMNGHATLSSSSLLAKKGHLQQVYARVQGKSSNIRMLLKMAIIELLEAIMHSNTY